MKLKLTKPPDGELWGRAFTKIGNVESNYSGNLIHNNLVIIFDFIKI